MPAYTIEKLRIKDGIPTINYSAADAAGKRYSVPGAEFTDPVHIDLQKRLDSLNVHLALSTSMLPIPADLGDINEELLTYYHMHGISIKEDGVTLSGHKILPNKKAFNFNSPFIRYAESEETQYTFVEELIATVEALQKEVCLYLDGSKRATDAQLNLFNQPPAEPITKAQILPATPAAGTFNVETSAGVVSLPILPENGTIKEIPEDVPNADFEIGPVPDHPGIVTDIANAAAKGETKQAKGTATGRKREPQSAKNPSGIVE